MARYNRERGRQDYDREGEFRNYSRRENEDRGLWDRAGDEVRSWFGNEEAERRRRMDDMRRAREERSERWRESERPPDRERDYGRDYRPDYGTEYGRGDRGWESGYDRRYGQSSDNTWGAGRRGYGREESEDWRHLDDYWSDMYGERYPGRETSERAYRPTFGGENFGGLGGPTNWMQGRESHRGMTTRGNFSGRGPRNYKRSDERILEDVNEELTRHPGIDATELDVTVQDGEVILRGTVDRRELKRMAEDCAEEVFGVKNVRNEIRVLSQWGKTPERAA